MAVSVLAAQYARGVRFVIGRTAGGQWAVADREGRVCGLFADRSAAIHFAIFESAHAPCAVCCLPDHAVMATDHGLAEGKVVPFRLGHG